MLRVKGRPLGLVALSEAPGWCPWLVHTQTKEAALWAVTTPQAPTLPPAAAAVTEAGVSLTGKCSALRAWFLTPPTVSTLSGLTLWDRFFRSWAKTGRTRVLRSSTIPSTSRCLTLWPLSWDFAGPVEIVPGNLVCDPAFSLSLLTPYWSLTQGKV